MKFQKNSDWEMQIKCPVFVNINFKLKGNLPKKSFKRDQIWALARIAQLVGEFCKGSNN